MQLLSSLLLVSPAHPSSPYGVLQGIAHRATGQLPAARKNQRSSDCLQAAQPDSIEQRDKQDMSMWMVSLKSGGLFNVRPDEYAFQKH